MKNMKKLLSLVLALLMVFSSVITVAAATETQPTTWWDKNAATSFAGGTGTEADPFLISTPAELAYFAKYLEGGARNGKTDVAYFQLTADLDMSAHQWQPVGYSKEPSNKRGTKTYYDQNTLNKCVFDGNGKTISGIYLTASSALGHTYDYGCALFTRIVDSTVKNLNLQARILDPVLKTDDSAIDKFSAKPESYKGCSASVASLAGGTYGNCVISGVNVTVDMDVNAKTASEVVYAGIVGWARENLTMENCTSNGTIDVTFPNGQLGYVSGMIGVHASNEKGEGTLSLNKVTNNANVTASANAAVLVAGVLTTSSLFTVGEDLAINAGDITATVSSTSSDPYLVGGVIAKADGAGTTVTNLANSGDINVTVTSNKSVYYVGGVAAYLCGEKEGALITITECENVGPVTVTAAAGLEEAETEGYVGGVLGNIYFGALSKCTNNACITFKNSATGMRLGGVAGNIGDHENETADQLVNRGDIVISDSKSAAKDRSRYVGGIAGNLAGPSITNSENYGDIILDKAWSLYNIGGITGNISCSRAGTISSNNVNNGDITVVHGNGNYHRYIGGLHGQNNGNNAKIQNGTNNGNIFSNGVIQNAYIGGLIATMSGTSLVGCTNNGEVKMTSGSGASGTRYVGGAVGSVNSGVITNFTLNNNVVCDGVAGGWYVGGVVGQMTGNTTVRNITINGNVDVQGANVMYVGGVVGTMNIGASNIFENCTVAGDVLAPRTYGGSGNLAVGGIIGRLSNDSCLTGNKTITLKNCTAYGRVSEGSLCGGIVGYSATSRKKINSSDTLETIMPYTVKYENCVSIASGIRHGMVGSNRSDHAEFVNCFSDTPYVLSYYNQCDDYLLGETVTINGIPMYGNDVSIIPETGCYAGELATMDKARVSISGTDSETASLRFDSYIAKTFYESLLAIEGVELEMGTLITATENLLIASVEKAYDKMAALDALVEDGDPSKYILHKVTAADFIDHEKLENAKDEYNYFAGVLRGISKESFDKNFTAIAYVKIVIGDFEVILYAGFDSENTERMRNVAQVSKSAFEDRSTEKYTINGWNYHIEADAENACFLGAWSLYNNQQLALLKAYSNYVNEGVLPDGLNVNGVSISEYKIVYAQSPIYKNYGSLTGKTLYEDLKSVVLGGINYGNVLEAANIVMDFDYQTAVRIQELIYAEYGVLLEVVEDAATHEGKYEILVGSTNRAKSKTTQISMLTADEFVFQIDESKIVVCGGAYGSTWHAVDALEKLFNEIDLANFNFKMAGDLSGEYYLQKIACIGDSITRGSQALPDGSTYGGTQGADVKYGSSTVSIYFEQYLSYPANLQRYMWKDTVVYNFGRGASTARNYGDSNYYAGSPQWAKCLETSADRDIAFDLVFLMHGTNDSGKDGGAPNWTAAQKEDFLKEIKNVMDNILVGSPDATFVMNNAPHGCYGRTEANDDAIRKIQKETAKKLLDMGYDVYHYNMEQYTMDHLTDEVGKTCGEMSTSKEYDRHKNYYNLVTPGNSFEGTHPNFRGYNKMAQGVQAVVEYLLFNGAKPTYMIDLV